MKLLRELIETKGHATIAQFMDIAMYDSSQGYYIGHNPIGKESDFITAPEISQLFGEMIGVYCVKAWNELGCPKEFNLVELGPGKATLMLDLIRATKHVEKFSQGRSIHLVDKNKRLIEIQRKRLLENKASWHGDVSTLPKDKPLIIIANEFFDCLPINRYIKRNNNWNEQVVSILPKQEEFCFSFIPVLAHFSDSLNHEYPNAKEGAVIEICYPAQQIIRDIASIFQTQPGAMLIIDYGYDYNNKTRKAFNGSLQAIQNHKFHPLLSDIGRADITAHVDFFVIKQTAEANFCATKGVISQRKFLEEQGIFIRAQALKKNANHEESDYIDSGLMRLMDPMQMGELFKVLEIFSIKN